jgi:hypothetical protein
MNRHLVAGILVAVVGFRTPFTERRESFMSAPCFARCLIAALLVAAFWAPVESAAASGKRWHRPAAFAPGALEETPPASALERKLMAPVKLDLKDQSLKDAIEILGNVNNVNLYIDTAALDAAGVNLSQLTSLKVENLSLKSALNLLLKQARLTYVIKDDVLQITTEEEARGKLKQVTYPVADLVIPPTGTPASADGPGRSTEDQLIKLITTTVAADSWSDIGGKGTIQYCPVGMALVVNQTQDVQEQIADLLAALRRLQDVTVTIETRLVTVPEELFARLGAELGLRRKCPAAHQPHGPTFLNDHQVRQLLEAAQADRRTSCMQAPKLTAFNGQTTTIDITDRQYFLTGLDVRNTNGQMTCVPKQECFPLGFTMTVEPVVSADRRYVRLKLAAKMTSLAPNTALIPVQVPVPQQTEGPGSDTSQGQPAICQMFLQQPKLSAQEIAQTCVVADGMTLALAVWKTAHETSKECGCPGLCYLPVVGDLFTNVVRTREPNRTLLLVTPRIVVNEPEGEVIFLGQCPAKTSAAAVSRPEVVPPPPCTVLDNVEKLNKARQILTQAELHLSTGDTEEARRALEEILRLCPGSCVAETATAYLGQLATGKPAATEEAAETLECANQSAEAAALVLRYQRACAAGQLREAQRLARKALALDPACFRK